MELAKEIGPGKRICVILPDSVRNYMTNFLDDAWMRENGFTESRWESSSVGDLMRSLPTHEVWTARPEETVAQACERMKEHGVSQLPVVEDGHLVGILAETDVLTRIVHGHTLMEDTVAEAMFREVRTVNVDDDASVLTQLFADGLIGIVVDDERNLEGVITKLDLVDFLTSSVETPG